MAGSGYGMERDGAMRIELRVDRNGQTIFRAERDTERGSSFAESPNSKKDPKTTKPQAVEKNANRRDPTGKSALKISA